MSNLLCLLAKQISDAAKFNKNVQATPAAVLWTDAERQWAPLIPRLREQGLSIVSLGDYNPAALQGPAIWLKCAVAGTLDDVKLSATPIIVYLPGISRTDLRAIESCPRDLQPLAELQYRGVFWSQVNGKDWTVNAFLSAKTGGLGLDVAQDKSTAEALVRAVDAGILFERTLVELQGRQINATWLDGLLAPNPARDLLVWLNDPQQTKSKWPDTHWSVFQKRCKTDYGFDPDSEGTLIAAEKLAHAGGAWAAVWELYRDSFASFPQVAEALNKVQPPSKGLFDGWGNMSGYPRANEEAESSLRYSLSACGAMTPDLARAQIAKLVQEHGCRQDWLWTRMGHAPLVKALAYLGKLADLCAQLPSGTNLDLLAESYRTTGWEVDAAAIQAMACVQSKADAEAVSAALQALYAPWLQDSAVRFQELVKASGKLGIKPTADGAFGASAGLCTFFVDGLRYDVAIRLQDMLSSLGKVTLNTNWTSMPSVTASGKAWCSPVAHLVAGNSSNLDFEPCVAEGEKPLSAYNFRKLLADQNVQPLDKHETGDPTGMAWVECGDLDHYGHEHGLRLARDMDTQLAQIVERIEELVAAGWKHFRIVTDHGWLLVPGGLPKTELAKHQAETRWGRCAVLKDSANGTPLTFGWDWCADVQVAFAPGIANFKAGEEYSHGGLSLQECLVPVLEVELEGVTAATAKITIESISWKSLRCVVTVSPEFAGLKADIRRKVGDAASSLVANVKEIENGKVSLAIADDDQLGEAGIVVILDKDGTVLQKSATTIGG